ncbi:hypothetical protein D3C84_945280 [compost metagenome]
MGESEKSIDHASLVINPVQIGLVDEVHHQALFGATAQAGANHPAHLLDQCRLVLDLLVLLEDQFKDVIQVDFLGLEQVHLEHHIVPVDSGLACFVTRFLAPQPIADVVVGGAIVLDLALDRHTDGLQLG